MARDAFRQNGQSREVFNHDLPRFFSAIVILSTLSSFSAKGQTGSAEMAVAAWRPAPARTVMVTQAAVGPFGRNRP